MARKDYDSADLKKLVLDLVKQKYSISLMERIVALQLIDHLQANNLMDMFQIAYIKYHSTETALLRVLMHLDKYDSVMIIFLDLSAAFGTIYHEVLFKHMEK